MSQEQRADSSCYTIRLLACASDRDGQHRPAGAAFDRGVRGSKGGVGIWHDTYGVPAGSYEPIHIDMLRPVWARHGASSP
ncbi:hypothetical protein RKD29_000078 [Streptomyces tendae]|uniref:monooxygenase family protein n=1 Tax=Streptomyces tendae TaxID=1932 RepID=UPI003835E629